MSLHIIRATPCLRLAFPIAVTAAAPSALHLNRTATVTVAVHPIPTPTRLLQPTRIPLTQLNTGQQ